MPDIRRKRYYVEHPVQVARTEPWVVRDGLKGGRVVARIWNHAFAQRKADELNGKGYVEDDPDA